MIYIGSFAANPRTEGPPPPGGYPEPETYVSFRIVTVAPSIDEADVIFRRKLDEMYAEPESPLRELPNVNLRFVLAIDPEQVGAFAFEYSISEDDSAPDVFMTRPPQQVPAGVTEFDFEGQVTDGVVQIPWYAELPGASRPKHGLQLMWTSRSVG